MWRRAWLRLSELHLAVGIAVLQSGESDDDMAVQL